jgi:aspartate carbamoyltransferase catalytic subunit
MGTPATQHRHLTKTTQLDRSWIESELFPLCDALRALEGRLDKPLQGRALYCLFYEPSFLTRVSFERAMGLLGGQAYHTEDASQFFPVRTPAHIGDTMNLLASLHVDLLVVRSSDPRVIEGAQAADVLPVVNGGSQDDHPTQALADLYTLRRELGGIDGVRVAVVGRADHRNVTALVKGLSLFSDAQVVFIPVSGGVSEEIVAYCEQRGVRSVVSTLEDGIADIDAVYLAAPSTLAHRQLLRARNYDNLRIDDDFMARLPRHCVVMDPMQRSDDFTIETTDQRLVFYRQAENALYVRMAVLLKLLPDRHIGQGL